MTSTPGRAVTRRTNFSPRKFLLRVKSTISTYSRHVLKQVRRLLQGPRWFPPLSYTEDILPLLGEPGNKKQVSSIPDLNLVLAGLGVLLNVDVDGEVGVDVAHLVLEALRDTDDHVVDDGADGAEGSDGLAGAMVHLNGEDVLLGTAEAHSDETEAIETARDI